jgi:3-oxoadipate enol-lactonase
VLLWPSLFCDARTLRPLADDLARDRRVLTFDPPGHGRSGPPAVRRFSLADCARATVEVLDRENVPRADVVGTAWGGMVAVEMAILFPERVGALVLINAPLDRWSAGRRLRYRLAIALFRGLGPIAPLVGMVTGALLSEAVQREHPERAELIADCLRTSDRRGIADAMASVMVGRRSQLADAGRVRAPALVLSGAEDRALTAAMARDQAARIPGARLVLVEGSAHASVLEVPERVVPLVREHVSRVPA